MLRYGFLAQPTVFHNAYWLSARFLLKQIWMSAWVAEVGHLPGII
jgi:hypothetical protein